MRPALAGLAVLLAGCAEPSSPGFQSAQYPPNSSSKSEPQSPNSLPPGATNPSRAPGATNANFLSFSFGLGRS